MLLEKTMKKGRLNVYQSKIELVTLQDIFVKHISFKI